MSKTLVVIDGENALGVLEELSTLVAETLEDVVVVSWQEADELSEDARVFRTHINGFKPDHQRGYIVAFTPQVFDGTMQIRLTARFIRAEPLTAFQVWRRNHAGVWRDATTELW